MSDDFFRKLDYTPDDLAKLAASLDTLGPQRFTSRVEELCWRTLATRQEGDQAILIEHLPHGIAPGDGIMIVEYGCTRIYTLPPYDADTLFTQAHLLRNAAALLEALAAHGGVDE